MTLKKYLHEKYRSSTAKSYKRDIDHYLQRQPNASKSTYAEVLNYLESQRRIKNIGCVHRILQSIKKYYDYLLVMNQRDDHPCSSLYLKDHRSKSVQLQDLFKEEELQSLLNRKERYEILKKRNQLILSLLIYQGLTTGELIRLTTESIDLEKGAIQVETSHRLNGRTLSLWPEQIMLTYHYLQIDRPKLLRVKTDSLLITKKGTAENGEGISYLVSTLQAKFPHRKLNPKTIRQSVIANLLAQGKDLRWVQIYAGHKYPSSTERYRQTNLDSLTEAIRKHHPLG